MSNEEQTVLDFFAREENLPLALIAAEHLDGIRLRLNNAFWLALRERLGALISEHKLPWVSELTEDRNTEDCLVGLHVQPLAEQRVFLRPFMEQQFLGDTYRVYHGLMWNTAPDAGQKTLPAVATLQQQLVGSGFKPSDSFLAWQWLPWHPRRKDFLLRLANHREELLEEALRPWQLFLLDRGEGLQRANIELNSVPPSTTVSLEQLRSKIKHS